MYVLNTTFHVHKSVEEAFILWIKKDYIHSALSSGVFCQPSLLRLMLEVQEDSSSFALGLKADDMDVAASWHDNAGAELRRKLYDRFGEKVVFFTTCMEELAAQ